jgi:hypothetical protein
MSITSKPDLLSQAAERADKEHHEKFRREAVLRDLKRPAVQERIRKMQAEKEAEKPAEPDAQE